MTTKPNETTRREPGHLTVYWLWPLATGLAVATVVAISTGGIWVIVSGGNWRAAATAAGLVWFALLGLATLAVFVYAAWEWRGPRARGDRRVFVPLIGSENSVFIK